MPEQSLPRSNISTRSARANISAFAIRPLIPAEWAAFEDLFGPDRGASSGCWCMWTRMPRPQWKAMPRDDRKAAFRAIVESGPAPGPAGLRRRQGRGLVRHCATGGHCEI